MSAHASPVKELFAAAVEYTDPVARAEFLDRECGADVELRRRLDQLLLAHDHPESVLERPLVAPAETAAYVGPSESAGAVIAGRYKLLERLGEGGMGEVWVAEQLEPIKRRVAIKLIKPGMDSRAVLARFEAERQALALMDHPNIARVLDAGYTGDRRQGTGDREQEARDRRHGTETLSPDSCPLPPDPGRPYFVMELVKGTPITQFCDERKLTTRERLELFVPVCHAIQHAHQKGIIHRDIKPSNVLVALHDEKPVPKVIDFGVAKAIGQQLTEKTLYTNFGTLVGTPAYMAPEQATFNQLDIDTRADIYSLGVLLYELLTGTTPLEHRRLNETGLLEALRIVREEEVPTLSQRLSSTAELPEIAARRGLEAAKLKRLVRGELDWIVMKALEKDRNRRYEMASGLAADIQRYLVDEPVQACPPTIAYRVRKFVRRNRTLVAAGSAVVLSLLVGLSLAVAGFVTARAEERVAVAEARKSRAVIGLVQDMLGSANPMTSKGPDYTVRQALDDFAARLTVRPMGEPEVEADVRATIGRAYRELGLRDEARSHLERALQLRREVHGGDHPQVAESLIDLAWTAFLSLDLEKSECLADEALRIYRRRGERTAALAEALRVRGLTLQFQGRWAEGEPVLREALAVAEESLVEGGTPLVSLVKAGLARTLVHQNRLDEAEVLAREALALSRALHGDHHPETADRLWVLGDCLSARAQRVRSREATAAAYAEAEQHYRAALDALRRVHGGPHPSQLGILEGLVTVLRGQYRPSDPAIGQARADALLIARRTGVMQHRLISHLCWARLDETDLFGAEQLSREAVGLLGKQEGPYHSPLLPRDHESRYTMMRAWHLQQVGREKEAQAAYARILPVVKKMAEAPTAGAWPFIYYAWASLHGGGDNLDALDSARRAVTASASDTRSVQALALHARARALHRTGHLPDAIESQRAALGVVPDYELFTRRFIESALVEYLEENQDPAGAVQVLRDGIVSRQTFLPAGHPEIATAQANLAALLVRRKEYSEAKQLLDTAYQRLAIDPATDRARLRHSTREVVKFHEAQGDGEEAEKWRTVLCSLDGR